MAKVVKIVVAGQGAFGIKHLEALQKIEGVQVVSLAGGNQQQTEEVARNFAIPHWTGDLAESLAQDDDSILLEVRHDVVGHRHVVRHPSSDS